MNLSKILAMEFWLRIAQLIVSRIRLTMNWMKEQDYFEAKEMIFAKL